MCDILLNLEMITHVFMASPESRDEPWSIIQAQDEALMTLSGTRDMINEAMCDGLGTSPIHMVQ